MPRFDPWCLEARLDSHVDVWTFEEEEEEANSEVARRGHPGWNKGLVTKLNHRWAHWLTDCAAAAAAAAADEAAAADAATAAAADSSCCGFDATLARVGVF